MVDGEQAGFGVYIHWPFCLSKCPYCDFNSHVRREPIDEPRFVRAFAAEIAATAARVPDRTVSTIFFGGGTPSLMQPATVGSILDAIAKHWRVAPDVEVSLEANPTSVEATRFRDRELQFIGPHFGRLVGAGVDQVEGIAVERRARDRDRIERFARGVQTSERL